MFVAAAYSSSSFKSVLVGIATSVVFCCFVYSSRLGTGTEIERRVELNYKTTTTAAPSTPRSVPKCRTENVNAKVTFEYAMESLHKERIATLTNVCRQQGLHPEKMAVNRRLLCSNKYKFGVCDIQKCGSTSWLQAILVAEGFFEPEDYTANRIRGQEVMNLANKKLRFGAIQANSTSWHGMWKDTLKIITVRDPFSRIVSAYNDKLALNSPGATESFYKPMSQRISARYRGMRHNVTDRSNLNGGMATFEDFVHHLIASEDPPDSHWMSYDSNCRPCLYKYDIVVKFETLTSDMRYLEKRLNITGGDRSVFFPNRDSRSNAELVKSMFKQVSRTSAAKLFAKFKMDFDLFGYPRPEWLN